MNVWSEFAVLIQNDDDKQLRKKIKSHPDVSQTNDWTLLMLTVVHDADECAKVLVEAGVDLNKRNDIGQTALMIASFWRKIEMAQFLLEQGAEVSLRDDDDESAFDIALKMATEDKDKRDWFEIFTLYKKNFDTKDLARYHEQRLCLVFKIE